MSCQLEVIDGALVESGRKAWQNMSPALSSATTTDEDFSFCGTPKQRWADLSEEDDDLFTSERTPFDFLSFAEEETQTGLAKCAEKVETPISGDEMHKTGAAPFSFAKQSMSGGQHPGRLHDKKQNRRDMVPFLGMLPPSVETHMHNAPSQSVPTSTPQGKAATSGVLTVKLTGIPVKLCNEACLDAILWAAGVQTSVLGYKTQKVGQITIDFSTMDAATSCCNHFKACAWTTGKLRVEMEVPPRAHNQGEASEPANNRRPTQPQSTRYTPTKHSKNLHTYQRW